MEISIIIIGRNSSKTLSKCINSICSAIKKFNRCDKYEILYIDSLSSDNSIEIAKQFKIKIISITSGFVSASLGRYLGKKYSIYDNLVFIDSDMYLDENWFNNSIQYYNRYGAIIGERYEKLYRDNRVIKEIPKFYNIINLEVVLNIGGFLMIKKDIVKNINYTPIVKNEEEIDFYAKFYPNNKIYKIPVLAYVHNNYNLTGARIKDYLNPYDKNGYILSFFNSIKYKYFKSFVTLQKKYIVSAGSSMIFYMSLFFSSYEGLFISLMLLFFNGRKQIKGSLMTMIFFPYKFIMSLFFLTRKRVTFYVYKGCEYKMEIKI